MAGRKSYIEIGWKLDKSGLREANRLTDDLSHTERSAAQGSKEIAAGLDRVGRSAQTSKSRVNEMGNGIDKAGKHAIRLRDIFKGTLIASATVSGVHALVAGVGSLSQEMTSNAKAWQTFTGNMQAFGESSKQINKVKGDLQDFAVKTIYSASDMASTYSQLKATGTKNTEALVKGFGGLAASAEDPVQAMKSLSQQATQMAALPKVQWGDLRIMMQQAPAGISAVSKAMGMSMGQLISKVHAGSITTKEFLTGITKAGNDPSFQKMATQYKTWDQAVDGLRENLANQASPAFNKLNKVAIKAISGINDALTGVNGKKLANDMDPYIKKMEDFMEYVGKNGDSFAEIGKDVLSIGSNLGKGAWSVIGTTINVLGGNAGASSGNNAKKLADSMDSIASHKTAIQAIGGIFATYFVASKMLAFAKSLREVALGLGLVKTAKSGTTAGGILSGVGSGSWVLGGIKTNRSKLVKEAAENAPDVGSRVVRNSLSGRVGSVVSKIGSSKLGSVLGGVKAVGSKIPYLDIAMAGTSLIGMNKKNAGTKVGDFAGTLGGMEAGAAVGSFAGPIGTIIGGTVGAVGGGALGSKVGSWAQKQLPGIKKSLSSFFSGIGKWAGKQWKSIGKFFGGIGSWFKGVGKGLDKNIVKPVSKAFTSVVTTAKRWGGKVKNAMLAPFYFLVGAGHRYIVKPLQKPVTKALSWVSKKWKAFSKTASKLWKSISGSMSKAFTKGINAIKKIAGAIGGWLSKKWRGISKVAGRIWSAVSSAVSKPIIKGVNVVKNVWKGATTWLSKTWSGLTGIASTVFSAVGNAIKKPIGVAWSYISGIFDKIKTAVKGVVDKVGGVVNGVKNWASGLVTEGKHVTGHATGGKMLNNHTALVGEGGPELAYKVNGASPRLYGANGPQFARVRAGERILNARDTAKVLSGGLGAGMVLKGYAGGTAKLKTGSIKTKVASFSKPSTKGIDDIYKAYAKTTKKSNKSITSFNSSSKKSWKSISNDTKKQSNLIQKNTVTDFDQMQKGVHTQMVQMGKQVDSNSKATAKNFGSNMGRMDNYAHSAMSSAIDQLNKGFTSVNGVLGQFGGSKSVLKLAHYAQGTNGPIANDQYAVLNDAKSGPMQEAVVRNNQLMKPQGRNAVVPLKHGDEVLNGHALEKLPHYAKGTGKDALKRVIENNQKNPTKAFESDFASRLGAGIGTTLSAGVNANDKGGASSVGNPWYSSVWNVLSDAMSGGSAAGGSWAHSPGAGWSHTDVFGSPRSGGVHDGNDYSAGQGSVIHAVHGGKVVRAAMPPGGWGAVGYSIITKGDDGQYVMYQEFGHANNAKVSVGDTVKTGQPIATLGHSGLGTGPHVHIGVSKNYPFSNNGMSTSGWENLMDMRGGSSGVSKKDKNAKGDSTLDKYVKKQLAGQVKWVSKNLSDEVGDIGSLGISGSIASRAKILAAAIKKAYPSATNSGIAAVLGNWEFESGLNPGAINPGGGASGLGQWLGGRKTNLINYARKHGQNWNNAGAQLDFALHGDGSDSGVLKRILSGTGSVASLANQFSSQWERGGYNAQHVAGAMKIASALKGFAGGGHPGTGQTVLVGEHGPELARFEQPATIYSNAASPQVAGQLANGATSTLGGRAVSIKLDVNVKATPGADGKKFGNDTGDAIADRLKIMFNSETDTRNEQ